MRIKRHAILVSLSAITLASGACTPGKNINDIEGQYWQRVHASEAIWLQGPKAQQTLNRNIARCVSELRELERLGAVKNAIPADYRGRVLDPDYKALEEWDTPERDNALFADHSNYQDFEGCMLDKGWERVMYVGFEESGESRRNYLRAHVDYEYRSKRGNKKKDPFDRPNTNTGPYGNLND